MECQFPSNIIEELYVISKEESEKWKSDQNFRNELLEKAKKKIIETSDWTLRNGIGTGTGNGWQIAGLKSQAEYMSRKEMPEKSKPGWLTKIKNFFT